jgi:ABC-type branched-subunit amino acid transport system substrate-binding protein
MSNREEHEPKAEYSQRHQEEAINKSIDETKDNIRRAIEEVRRETPRYSQTVTDFHNETAEAAREIADNFLDSQKEIINSIRLAWTPFVERAGGGSVGNYWMGMYQPWWWMALSPKDITDIYTRGISAMTDWLAASTRMATYMMFAGMEATRATTNYARQNSREIARITSHTVRIFGQSTRETVVRMQEGSSNGGTTPPPTTSRQGGTTGKSEEGGTETTRKK